MSNIEKIAAQFRVNFNADLVALGYNVPETLHKIDTLNRGAYKDMDICASHDFADPNMALHAAFVAVMGRDPDLPHEMNVMYEAFNLVFKEGFAK